MNAGSETSSSLAADRATRFGRPDLLVMAITLTAAAIRFGNIALVEQDFSLDESYTIYVNTLPLMNWWSFIIMILSPHYFL